MKKISCKTYSIHINNWDALNAYILKGDFPSVFVLVDNNTFQLCLPLFEEKINSQFKVIVTPSGEENKTLDTCQSIWDQMIQLGADRHSLCINLGGGVIGDMGGFAACTMMRGMDFVQVPTTLLSQVDASVGGKLGVDYKNYKNLIGIIKNPGAVFMFTDFLKTLPYKQLLSGFAEVIKHGLIRDIDAFQKLTKLSIEWPSARILLNAHCRVEPKNQPCEGRSRPRPQRDFQSIMLHTHSNTLRQNPGLSQ